MVKNEQDNHFICSTLLLLILPILWMVSGCNTNLPRDPENTLNNVQGKTLRLGIISHAPWVSIEDEELHGLEFNLVQQLAVQLDAEIVWQQASLTEIIEGLENFQLDMAIGGFIQSPFIPDKVAHTLSYYSEDIIIATNEPIASFELEGTAIFVEFGSPYINWLEAHGAIPQPIHSITRNKLPAIMPAYQAEAWGLNPTNHMIDTHAHILLLPPGENGWLDYVEAFLLRLSKGDIENQLMNSNGA